MPAPAMNPALAGEEFHQIAIGLEADTTEVTCAGCEFAEHTGSGLEGHAAHGAQHAIATGHTVTERHVRTTVIGERRGREAL